MTRTLLDFERQRQRLPAWTGAEDACIVAGRQLTTPAASFSSIASSLPGRSSSDVVNRWRRHLSSSPDMVHDGTVGGCASWLLRVLSPEGAWSSARRSSVARQLREFARLYLPDPCTALSLASELECSATALSRASEPVYRYTRQAAPADADTLLRRAAETGDLRLAQSARGAVLDASDYNGTTALMAAALHGHLHMVSWLLSAGASPDATDVFGDSYKVYYSSTGSGAGTASGSGSPAGLAQLV